MKVKYKFWFLNRSSEEQEFHQAVYPVVGDTICYKDKFFKVVERVFYLNNEDYNIIHCEEWDYMYLVSYAKN